MALAIQSSSNGGWIDTGNTSMIAPKPTGLAVGDLMIGIATTAFFNNVMTAASGWTEIQKGFVDRGDTVGMYVGSFWKIADSGDAAASNITYATGTNNIKYCSLFRITGHNASAPIGASAKATATNTGTPSFANTVTPPHADTLLFIAFAGVTNNNNMGGYAIATDNPGTWTEQIDTTNVSPSPNMSFHIATAPRTQTTATGNSSATGGDAGSYWAGHLIAVDPAQTVNYTLTAALGTFALTSITTGLKLGIKILAALGTFALTSITTGLKWGRKMTAAVGAFTLTYLTVVAAFGKLLAATTGAFVLTGIDASIRSTRKIVADLGTFTLTGINAIMTRGGLLVASLGTFALTYQTVGISAARKIVAALGTFTLTGINAVFPRASKIFALTGAYILSGQVAILRGGRGLVAAVGTFVLTGKAALFPRASKIFALTGAFTLTGYAARGLQNGFSTLWRAATKHTSTWINKLRS